MDKNLFNHLTDTNLKMPQGIFQIGASYGQELELFKEYSVHNCIMVEPLPDPFNYIAAICKNTPNYIAINALCSDVIGDSVDFYIANNGGQSSSMMRPLNHLEVFSNVKFDSQIKLSTTTVDQICAMLIDSGYASVLNNIDTMYLDVQGAEYKVLMGSIKLLKNIKYIYFELIRGDLYEKIPDLSVFISFLGSIGFVINNINYNQYHHANVLFINKNVL
jgi:FkbM family methyltransferase